MGQMYISIEERTESLGYEAFSKCRVQYNFNTCNSQYLPQEHLQKQEN